MTDRGLPIVDGAPACPFVAFEDDRDGRALAPDHRHRCFAEPRPAPRALAHQEAYCLASAFPVCPTFQDWARREAAAARPLAAQSRPPGEDPPVSRPMPPLDREERRAAGIDTPPPIPSRRSQRDWAAPPPWSGEPGTVDPNAVPPPRESRGLADSAAARLAGPDPSEPLPARHERPAPDHDLDTDYGKPGAAGAAALGAAGVMAAAGSSPGSAAPASAGPGTERVTGAASVPTGRPDPRDEPADDEPDWADEQPEDPYAPRPRDDRAHGTHPRQPIRDDRVEPAPNPRDQVHRREAQDPSDLFGPAWERPHRYEAYPSLQSRVGLPAMRGIGRIGAAALGLLLAALALFFIGPMLLGIGRDDGTTTPGGGVQATPTPAGQATPTPVPTEPPAPTAQVYVVAKNDTMSKIAKKFGLTIEQLMAANPQITDPDKIAIGDQLTIPAPVEGVDGDVDSESAAP